MALYSHSCCKRVATYMWLVLCVLSHRLAMKAACFSLLGVISQENGRGFLMQKVSTKGMLSLQLGTHATRSEIVSNCNSIGFPVSSFGGRMSNSNTIDATMKVKMSLLKWRPGQILDLAMRYDTYLSQEGHVPSSVSEGNVTRVNSCWFGEIPLFVEESFGIKGERIWISYWVM